MYDDLFQRSIDVIFLHFSNFDHFLKRNRDINGKRCFNIGNAISLGYRYQISGEKRDFARESSVFAKNRFVAWEVCALN